MRMRKLAVVVTSGVMLGGMTVGAPSAWAHQGDTHGSSDDGDFTVYGRFTDFDKEDNGEAGWSEGDVVTFAFDLFQKGEGQVGEGDGECTVTEADKAEREFSADCEGVFDLEDGTIDMAGTVTEEDFHSGEIEMDIVGGGGDYDDADGTVTFSRPEGHGGHGGHGGHDGHAKAVSYGTASAGGDHGDKGDHRGHGDKGGHGHHGGGHWFKADVDLD